MTDSAAPPGRLDMSPMKPEGAVMTPFMRGDLATGTNYQAQYAGEVAMAGTGEIEKDILQDLERQGPCSIEEMVAHLPGYTWNQVFNAVDRLSRNAKVMLQHPSRFGYQVSLAQAYRPSAPVAGATGGHRSAGRFDRAHTGVRGTES
jgi:hypothetical protein